MVNNSKAYRVAVYANMFATIFVAMMLDRVISVGLPTATAACVLLVTFSFCFLENRWSTGVWACTLFGLASFVKEFIFPSSVAAFPIYVWPVITVFPRIVMGFVAFAVYRIMLRCMVKFKNAYSRQILCMSVASFLGLVTNTILFLSALNVCKQIAGMDYSPLITTIKVVLYTNIIPEYLISMILSPYVVLGVRRGLKLGVDGNNWKQAQK